MDNAIEEQIGAAVTRWAQAAYRTSDIVVADVSPDEEEPDCYLAVLAVRSLGYWLVAEVWLNDGQVEAVNDLGEGLPLTDQAWPWPEDELENE